MVSWSVCNYYCNAANFLVNRRHFHKTSSWEDLPSKYSWPSVSSGSGSKTPSPPSHPMQIPKSVDAHIPYMKRGSTGFSVSVGSTSADSTNWRSIPMDTEGLLQSLGFEIYLYTLAFITRVLKRDTFPERSQFLSFRNF